LGLIDGILFNLKNTGGEKEEWNNRLLHLMDMWLSL